MCPVLTCPVVFACCHAHMQEHTVPSRHVHAVSRLPGVVAVSQSCFCCMSMADAQPGPHAAPRCRDMRRSAPDDGRRARRCWPTCRGACRRTSATRCGRLRRCGTTAATRCWAAARRSARALWRASSRRRSPTRSGAPPPQLLGCAVVQSRLLRRCARCVSGAGGVLIGSLLAGEEAGRMQACYLAHKGRLALMVVDAPVTLHRRWRASRFGRSLRVLAGVLESRGRCRRAATGAALTQSGGPRAGRMRRWATTPGRSCWTRPRCR
jgi:hypothetical protein